MSAFILPRTLIKQLARGVFGTLDGCIWVLTAKASGVYDSQVASMATVCTPLIPM